MSEVIGDLSRALLKYPHLVLENLNLIGWGAGQWFRDYFPLTNLPLKYTVCPVLENQGKVISGISVKSPDSLINEDPRSTLVVIFSASSNEITNEIRRISPSLPCIPALNFGYQNVSAINSLQILKENMRGISYQNTVKEYSRIGFFTKGLYFHILSLH